MPKGKGAAGAGIDGAWETDASSIEKPESNTETPIVKRGINSETIKRLSFTLSPAAYEAITTELTRRKQQGLRANRSQFIEDAILYYLEHNK